MNCKIHPVLYQFYLRLHNTLRAKIVHRRKRRSKTSIEVVFYCEGINVMTGRLNTLPEAEKCGYWVMCRLKPNTFYDNRQVYQLFLTPVHPKKHRGIVPVITPLYESESAAIMTA